MLNTTQDMRNVNGYAARTLKVCGSRWSMDANASIRTRIWIRNPWIRYIPNEADESLETRSLRFGRAAEHLTISFMHAQRSETDTRIPGSVYQYRRCRFPGSFTRIYALARSTMTAAKRKKKAPKASDPHTRSRRKRSKT